MKELKICFIGIGSIAKRHIKNLLEICNDKDIIIEIDALRRYNHKVDANLDTIFKNVYYDYENLPDNYDAIFITNPTEYHIDTLEKVHNRAKHFFIEKPITSYGNLEEVLKLQYRNETVYYVACPLRYSNVIQYIKNSIDVDKVRAVRCISSSYLPEWRPGVDYRDTYSAHKRLGGGVSIDLIHEWDYIQYIFGKPNRVMVMSGKKSNLEIDCEDYACYIAEYYDKVIELHLDYFGRYPIREIMLVMDDDTIVGDLIKCNIKYLKLGKAIDLSEDRNDFQKKELNHFLKLIENNKGENCVYEAYSTMNLTQGVVQ